MKTQKRNKTKRNKTKRNKVTLKIEKINNYNVLFIKNKSPNISIQSYIFKGFIHENRSNLGVNHLLEHVLCNAYKNCENYNCYEYLNLLGLLSNASTEHNIIKYYATGLLKDSSKILEYIINITANPVFNEKLVTKEKEAVHNELLITLDNPDYKVFNEMNKHFYNVEGLKYMDDDQLMIDNLKDLDYNYLMKYYKQNYDNYNTLFVISGDYNKKEIMKILKKSLSVTPIIKDNKNYRTIKCFSNKKGFHHIKNPAIQSSKILFQFPGHFYTNSDKLIRLTIASSILQIILFEQLRVEEELIYNIKFNTDVNTCGTVQSIFVNTKNINVKSVLKACKRMIDKYKNEKIPEVYIEAEKKKYLVNYNDKKYDATKYADLYGSQYIYKHFLKTKILSPEEFKNCIVKINAQQIKDIINEVFNFNRCVIVYSNNEKKINDIF